MELQTIAEYPAYYVSQRGGHLYGVPSSTRGLHHVEPISITDAEDKPRKPYECYIADGYIYLTYRTAQTDEDGEPVTDSDDNPVYEYEHYRQALGSDTVESVDTAPGVPERAAVSGTWGDYEISGSEVYRNGVLLRRHELIHAAVLLDTGLLYATESELLFLPDNRTSVNRIDGAVRLYAGS